MVDLQETKIRQKESVYRKLYSSLLQRKRELLKISPIADGSSDKIGFNDERQLLAQVVRTETSNLLFGIATTAAIFAVLRFGPNRYIRSRGGDLAQAMKQAEEDARNLGTAGVQKRVGFRAYDFASQQSTSSYTTVSQIPLCKGRSRISEALCPEWVDITNNQIPREFWEAHEKGKLRDEKTWTAFRQFSLNCQRRYAFEKQTRREQNIADDSPVNLLERVPENIHPE